jgi:phage terminase large subunit-like protein
MYDEAEPINVYRNVDFLKNSSGSDISNNVSHNAPTPRSIFYRSNSMMNVTLTDASDTLTLFSGEVIQTSSDRHLITAYGSASIGASGGRVVVLPFETSRTSENKKNQIVVAHLVDPVALPSMPGQVDVFVTPTGAAPTESTRVLTLVTFNPARPLEQVKIINTDFEGAMDVVFTASGSLTPIGRVTTTFENGRHYFYTLGKNRSAMVPYTYSERYGNPATP